MENVNHKKLWKEHELQKILDQRKPDAQLALDLGRTVSAIKSMRTKIKKGEDIPDYIAEMKLIY